MKTESGDLAAEAPSPFGGDQISSSFPFFDPFNGGSSSLGFMELLGFQDFSSGSSIFDFPPPTPMMVPPQESSEGLNLPATPNESSISSSSTEAPNEPDPAKAEAADDDSGRETKSSTKEGKKKGQKRQREPRFAFLTRSDVDHLEDGYRWRKYGQKAVKNSPFPRSYYRCTTASCGVKKRVERSSKDPAVVITTYQGRHTHQSPAAPRGGHHLMHAPPPMPGQYYAAAAPRVQQLHDVLHLPFVNSYFLPPPPPPQPSLADHRRYCNPTATAAAADISSLRDHGLLQDLIPSQILKTEDHHQY